MPESAVGALTNRIHDLPEQENRSAGGNDRLSFSIGHAGTGKSGKADFSRLFSLADEAMYAQKRAASESRGEARLAQ